MLHGGMAMTPMADIQENIFYRLILYGYWLTVCNCYFFLFCIPLSLALFLWWNEPNIVTLMLLLAAFIPIGPALTAAYSVMGKIVREKQVEITKAFFKSFKTNFIQSAVICFIQTVFTAIVIIDILFLKQYSIAHYIAPLLYVLLLINVAAGMYMYPLLSYFSISNKSAIKLAVWCAITKWKTTILLLAVLFLLCLIFYYVPKASFYFFIGPFCFIVMLVMNRLLQEIEKNFKISS
jgi:uncharacterized membrane protein YesL